MIALLGASGYVGLAFQAYFRATGVNYLPVSRSQVDSYDFEQLAGFLQKSGASFLINAAGYTGKPNVDACETHKADCLMGNAVLPGRIRLASEMAGIPWGHVSSGCIYNGRNTDGSGFSEIDQPNFSFRSGRCSFYSGTKALGEELLEGAACYIWRLRMPFSASFDSRNYLAKLINYDRLLEGENSLSHLGEFVATCHRCLEAALPFGIYNLTNPGQITTREIIGIIQKHLKTDKEIKYFENEEEFLKKAAIAPRSNCVLDTSKQERFGLQMRPVRVAIEDCLSNWEGPHPHYHKNLHKS